jgi:hypothetical protein
VGATQGCGVGGGDTEQAAGALTRGVDERDGCPERVDVHHVEPSFVHAGVGIAVDDLAVLVVAGEVLPGEFDGLGVDVTAGDVVALGGRPDAPDAAGGHRVEVRVGRVLTLLADRPEDGDGHVPVQFHVGVVEDPVLLAVRGRSGDREFDATLLDSHTRSRSASPVRLSVSPDAALPRARSAHRTCFGTPRHTSGP